MYQFFLDYQLNLYAILLLGILFFSLYFKREIYRFTSRLLSAVSVVIILMLIIEIFSWVFDGVNQPGYRPFNIAFNWIFFVFGPIAPGLMASYVDYVVNGDKERIRRRFFYMQPFIINIVLGIVNLFIPIISSVSSDNVYQREALLPLGFIPTYLLLLYCLYLVFKNRKNLTPKVSLSISFFLLMPITGAILQMLFFGLKLMWSMLALGVIVAYIFTEMISTQRDYLTRLYTREATTEHIKSLLERNLPFTMIIFDINDIKKVNDQFGHRQGDRVLQHFAMLLEKVFGHNSIVARFGGDEFVVVSNEYNDQKIKSLNDELVSQMANYKELDILRDITCAIGYEIRNTNSTVSLDELYHKADINMYTDKSQKKAQLKRRVSDK